jgi:hypothetical protein
MKHSKGFLLLLTLTSYAAFAEDTPAPQDCRPVHAVLTETRAPENCPTFFCATGTIEGNRGLNGTTRLELDGSGAAPPTAPGWNIGTGLQTITTDHGTLTLREVAVFKFFGTPPTALEAVGYEIITADGRYEGATGSLWAATTGGGGTFTHNITGTLCLNRRHAGHW